MLHEDEKTKKYVGLRQETSKMFEILNGVRQGCVSPILFTIVLDVIIKNVGIKNAEKKEVRRYNVSCWKID